MALHEFYSIIYVIIAVPVIRNLYSIPVCIANPWFSDWYDTLVRHAYFTKKAVEQFAAHQSDFAVLHALIIYSGRSRGNARITAD